MQINVDRIAIGIFICVAIISQGIIFGVGAEAQELTHEELVEKVNAQEKRIVRLELIIDVFKNVGAELNDPAFETEIDAAVVELIDAEPEKNKLGWSSCPHRSVNTHSGRDRITNN